MSDSFAIEGMKRDEKGEKEDLRKVSADFADVNLSSDTMKNLDQICKVFSTTYITFFYFIQNGSKITT